VNVARACAISRTINQHAHAYAHVYSRNSVYVFGGSNPFEDVHKNKDADVYDPVADATKRVDVNAALSEPSYSNMYATMFVLPQGKLAVFNHNHAQVRCLFFCVVAVLTKRRNYHART
jgi:hypothetical protein